MYLRPLTLLALPLASVAVPATGQVQQTTTPTPSPGIQPAPAGSTPQEAEVEEPEAEIGTEITVVGQRERGSVPGDIQPEQVLRPGDIRSYGVSSITDLIAELSPQLGSGRGAEGGQPVFLLNGRRISSPREIGNYPPEAIERIDILPPEAAQQLGYRAEQRVINFVLRRRFNAVTAELEGGGATGGDRYTTDDEISLLKIMRDKRINLSLNYEAQTPVYESDRDIIPTTPSRPYSITGNLTPGTGLTQIDPALSAIAGSPVTVAGVPAGVVGRPTLQSFLGGVNPSQFSNYRTLSPAQQQFEATASYAQPIFGDVAASITAEFDWTKRDSELGLATTALTVPGGSPFSPFANPVTLNRYLIEGGAREQTNETNRAQISAALNGDIGRWRWSMDGNFRRNFSSTFTDNSFDLAPLSARIAAGDAGVNPFAFFDPALLGAFRQDYARSLRNRGEFTTQVNGPLFALPAGDVRANLRTGFVSDALDGRSIRNGVVSLTETDRKVGNGQVRLDVPIANRGRGVLSAIGNLSVNGSYAYEQVSDFGWLSTYSGGFNWSPLPGRVSLIGTFSRDENAPSPEQLGNPVIITPDVRVFDFVRGVSADVTTVTGGNPNLLASQRRVTNFTLNARPFSSFNLNLNAEYTRTRTLNPIESLSTPTAALEAVFPDRFIRDAGGALIRVDTRPINVQETDVEQLRYGFNIFHSIGRQPQQGFGGFGGGGRGGAGAAARPAAQAPTAAVGSNGPEQRTAPGATPATPPTDLAQTTPPPPPPGAGAQGFGGGGGGRRFGGGGGGGGRGRFGGGDNIRLSVFHTWRFRNTLTFGPGIPVLDRLNGDGTNITNANTYKHQVQANGGITKSGVGLNLNATWQSGGFIRGGSASNPVDIRSDPFTRINLRSFVQFTPDMGIVRDHPWLIGTRVSLGVNNLFDARQRITDANGTVPINFQPDLIDPIGRTVTLSIRKLFSTRPQGRGGALGFGGGGGSGGGRALRR